MTTSRARLPPHTSSRSSRARRSRSSTTRRPTARVSPTRPRRRSTRAASRKSSTKASTSARRTISALVSKIKASGADLVYWGGLHTEGGLIVRQMRDQGIKAPLMGGDGITSDEFATDRRPRRRRHADDLRARSAQEPGREGSRREIPRQEVRAGSLHALQLRGGRGDQAGGRAGEVARSQEGRRSASLRQEVQDRDRRTRPTTRRATSPVRLRDVRLEEECRRQDHLRRGCKSSARADVPTPARSPGRAFSFGRRTCLHAEFATMAVSARSAFHDRTARSDRRRIAQALSREVAVSLGGLR